MEVRSTLSAPAPACQSQFPGQPQKSTSDLKSLDHPRGVVFNFSWVALARLGLARGYALDAAEDPAAARDKARTAYQDFLTPWKDAKSAFPSPSKPKPGTRSCNSQIIRDIGNWKRKEVR